MDPSQFLKDLSERISNILPPSVQTMKSDCKKNIHGILVSAFNKLDLVTREEFDTQTKVLARSRKKIETLERKIQELEKNIQDSAK